MSKYSPGKAPGFMVYVEEWTTFIENYTDEEVGKVFKATLDFFHNGTLQDLDDRGMKLMLRQTTNAVSRDMEAYEEKCLRNAYNRYRGTVKNTDETPLEYDAWKDAMTTVEDGQPTSRTVTNNSIKSKISSNIRNNFSTNYQPQVQPEGGMGGTEKSPEMVFEEHRADKLRALEEYGKNEGR